MLGGSRGEAAWIEEALDRYERPLLRYALRFVRDEETARDVVQDVFFKLCRAERAKVEERLASWLYTVCRNRALDVLKKERRMGRLEDAGKIADRGAGGPREEAELAEAQRLVLGALDELPSRQREAFLLKFQDDLSYREIGRVLDVSLGNVSKLVATALAAVRDRLQEDNAEEGKG
jgi:RNA polymerase sigma factor (sigma-70 family)